MNVLTKELKNDLDLHEIHCAVNSREKRTMPVLFLYRFKDMMFKE